MMSSSSFSQITSVPISPRLSHVELGQPPQITPEVFSSIHSFPRLLQLWTSNLSPTVLRQVAAISGYMCASLFIVYFNRWLFVEVFPYPLFVSWVQQVVGLILYLILAIVGSRTNIPAFKRFHLERINPLLLWKIMPQVITFTLFVGLANICLEVVQVSTYQVARSLSLLFTVILSKILIGTVPTRLAMVGIALICTGVILNSLDPSTLSLYGLLLGASSSFFQSLNGVLVSKNMSLLNNDGQRLLLYNLTGASMTMIPLIFICGEAEAFAFVPLSPNDEGFFIRWIALLLSGAACIVFNLAQFIVINATSPTSMVVIGFAKSIVQSLGGILILGDIVTLQSLVGLSFSLAGTGSYAYGQLRKPVSVRDGSSPTDEEPTTSEMQSVYRNEGMSAAFPTLSPVDLKDIDMREILSDDVPSGTSLSPAERPIDMLEAENQGIRVD